MSSSGLLLCMRLGDPKNNYKANSLIKTFIHFFFLFNEFAYFLKPTYNFIYLFMDTNEQLTSLSMCKINICYIYCNKK
jgi:hypothetical protein